MNNTKGFIKLAVKGTLIVFSINVGLVKALDYLNPSENWTNVDFLEGRSLFTELIMVLLIAPLFETIIFQWLIIMVLLQIPWKHKEKLAIIISALAFAWGHGYNLNYQIVTLFIGIVLAQLFIVGQENYERGFLLVFLVHLAGNGLSYLPL